MFWLLPWDDDAELRHTPWLTWLLIASNVAAFIAMLAGDSTRDAWFHDYGLTPSDWHVWQFLTSDFVHADVFHLFFNMMFLLIFGDDVEDAFGPLPFLALYFAGGLMGDLLFVSANAASTIPSVGASGCIATLAGAYFVLFFRNSVGIRLMFLVFTVARFRMRTLWVMLLWFGVDVFRTVAGHGAMAEEGGVNFVAHGMGFLVGLCVALYAVGYGVRRRYDELDDGHDWLGYWPPSLEDKAPVRRRRAPPGWR